MQTKRKETKDKILGVAVGGVILVAGDKLKKGVIKQAPKIAAKVVKGIFKI